MSRPTARRSALFIAVLLASAAGAAAQGPVLTQLSGDAALDGLLPAPAAVAFARIGDRQKTQQHEVTLGGSLANPAEKRHFAWGNGKAVPFRLTYDGFGQLTYTVGGKILTFDSQGPFDAIGLRAFAGTSGASLRVDQLSLNLVPLPGGAFARGTSGGDGLDVRLIHGAYLQGGFVLRGELTMQWLGAAPRGSKLSLEFRAGSIAELGRDYCTSTVNSNGTACDLSWDGTTSISTSDLVLRATGGIPGGACLFLVGGTAQFAPFGNGWLCAGPPLDRFDPVQTFDASGSISLLLDYTSGPLGSGALAVAAGDRRYFQLWYRDAAALPDTSNFSDAVELTFVP